MDASSFYTPLTLGVTDGSNAFDTNSGANPAAAASTSPMVTDATGQLQTTPWYSSLLNSALTTAGQVFTSVNAQNTAANNLKTTTPASVQLSQNNTLIYVALAAAAIVLALLFRRRAA